MKFKLTTIIITLISCSSASNNFVKLHKSNINISIDFNTPKTILKCSNDMVFVSGQFCPDLRHTCIIRADKKRCLKYDSEKTECVGNTVSMTFCIDKEEWTEKDSKLPLNKAMWITGDLACRGIGKRLCTDDEWTFACEGQERYPYPYGYERRPDLCNIDISFDKLVKGKTLIDHRSPITENPLCLSPFGVHNMTGNIDEFTSRSYETKTKFKSILKGGYWGNCRNMCRPATTEHSEVYGDVQTGFRCCKNVK